MAQSDQERSQFVKMRPAPERFDGPLRYWVWSRTREKRFLVDLEAYNFNGICQCENFSINLEKFLKRGLTCQAVLSRGLVTLKERQRPQDALRCTHLEDGWMQWGLDCARVVVQSRKNADTKNTNETRRTIEAENPF